MDLNNIETFRDWDKWKAALGKAIDLGEAVGMSDDTIEKIGVKVGDMLNAFVDPENKQQRLLQELWRAGDDQERRHLTNMIVKMAKSEERH